MVLQSFSFGPVSQSTQEVIVQMPKHCEYITAHLNGANGTLYCAVNPSSVSIPRRFLVIRPGGAIPDGHRCIAVFAQDTCLFAPI